MKKVLALVLTCCLLLALFAACSSPSATDVSPSPDATTPSSQGTVDATPQVSDDTTPWVYAIDQTSGKFNPFFTEVAYDREVAEYMTQLTTMINDRDGLIVYNGIQGETRPYNGVDYFYQGIADITVDKKATTTVYTIHIRDDIKFSDGQLMDIDDIIFGMYVISDKDYDGSATFYSYPIIGMTEYRENNSMAGTLTGEQLDNALANLTDEQKAWVNENVILPVLQEELAWVASGDADQYIADLTLTPESKDKLAFFYALDENYDSTSRTEEEVIQDLLAQYDADYAMLGSAYAGDESYFAGPVVDKVRADLIESLPGEPVDYIAGIERIDDYTVQVTTNGYDSSAIYGIGSAYTAPLHYYGDESMYNYDAHQFGFTRGDLSKVRSNNVPMGAGPYKFIKFENKVAYFEANEYYWEGAPATKYVQFKETLEPDKLNAIVSGVGDVTNPSFNPTVAQQILETNSNGEINGDVIHTSLIENLGYGYLAMNAKNVSVGGEPGSDASKALRTAFATIFAVCRDVPIDSYYKGTANVINYPISNTSWAAPRSSDPDYEIAYSTKADGSPIYDASMNMQQKYDAAVAAAVDYLTAAGYTYDGTVFTAAPEGAALHYTVTLAGAGEGDHPSFGVVTDAAELLGRIGITLEINDVVDTQTDLFGAFNAEKLEMWCAAWSSSINVDLYQVYHSSNIVGSGTGDNIYHVTDNDLDALIMQSRENDDQTFRKAIFKQCFDIILDWAVEVPVYQRSNAVLFSAQRVDIDTLTPEMTPYWGWFNSIVTMTVAAQ